MWLFMINNHVQIVHMIICDEKDFRKARRRASPCFSELCTPSSAAGPMLHMIIYKEKKKIPRSFEKIVSPSFSKLWKNENLK